MKKKKDNELNLIIKFYLNIIQIFLNIIQFFFKFFIFYSN
jgi:hypothetical protein